MGKISVDAFLREYGVAAKQKGTAMENFIKKHIVVDYVDFMTKNVYCTSIVNNSCHKKDGERKFIKIDSTTRYLTFVMRLIDLYTDIDIKPDTLVEDYDKLNKVGAINILVSAIPKEEYLEFSTLLDMKIDDLISNEYSLTAILYNLKESIGISSEVIGAAIEAITKEENNSND